MSCPFFEKLPDLLVLDRLDYLYEATPVQRRTITIGGNNMVYSLHTSDDIAPPSNSTNPNHVLAMRTRTVSNGDISKFVQYSPWPDIPPGNNNPPSYSGGTTSNYTQPYGNNAVNSQFEFYLPTNPGELANDYGTNLTLGNEYANGMYAKIATELYSIPPVLQSVYNTAFSAYWAYQSFGNAGDALEEMDDDLSMLL